MFPSAHVSGSIAAAGIVVAIVELDLEVSRISKPLPAAHELSMGVHLTSGLTAILEFKRLRSARRLQAGRCAGVKV